MIVGIGCVVQKNKWSPEPMYDFLSAIKYAPLDDHTSNGLFYLAFKDSLSKYCVYREASVMRSFDFGNGKMGFNFELPNEYGLVVTINEYNKVMETLVFKGRNEVKRFNHYNLKN
jgi:hypothetical protein